MSRFEKDPFGFSPETKNKFNNDDFICDNIKGEYCSKTNQILEDNELGDV